MGRNLYQICICSLKIKLFKNAGWFTKSSKTELAQQQQRNHIYRKQINVWFGVQPKRYFSSKLLDLFFFFLDNCRKLEKVKLLNISWEKEHPNNIHEGKSCFIIFPLLLIILWSFTIRGIDGEVDPLNHQPVYRTHLGLSSYDSKNDAYKPSVLIIE